VRIAYFITAHGYGHGVRACAIANEFSPDVQIIFRTALPEQFFREELKRNFEIVFGRFDCGCVQSDSVTVDIEKTLRLYSSIAEANSLYLKKEKMWCKSNNIDLIVSDITPFAFQLAHECEIPSVAISNFTWFDIYKEYQIVFPEFKALIDEIYLQYRKADLLLALQPSLEMDFFERIVSVPFVSRKGVNRKNEIYEKYCIPKEKRIGLIYIGDFGMNDAVWSALENFREWEFLGLHSIPGNPVNYHLVDKKEIRYQDLTASADVVISKIGYGVVSECILNGTPLIYLPRENFAEYPVLEAAVTKWGSGYCISAKDFYSLLWDKAFKNVIRNKRPESVFSAGAQQCAKLIESMI